MTTTAAKPKESSGFSVLTPLYYVFTWEMEIEKFTPQIGVPCGPHSLQRLKEAMKKLRTMGYSCHRFRDADGSHDDNVRDDELYKYDVSFESSIVEEDGPSFTEGGMFK